jgi:hypothetical protein
MAIEYYKRVIKALPVHKLYLPNRNYIYINSHKYSLALVLFSGDGLLVLGVAFRNGLVHGSLDIREMARFCGTKYLKNLRSKWQMPAYL